MCLLGLFHYQFIDLKFRNSQIGHLCPDQKLNLQSNEVLLQRKSLHVTNAPDSVEENPACCTNVHGCLQGFRPLVVLWLFHGWFLILPRCRGKIALVVQETQYNSWGKLQTRDHDSKQRCQTQCHLCKCFLLQHTKDTKSLLMDTSRLTFKVSALK